MAALQDIFAWRNISAAIESVKTGIPDRVPAVFHTAKEQVLGNETTYHTFYGQRKLVQRVEYAAPSRPYPQQKIGQKPLILTSFGGHFLIEQELMLRLRNVNDTMAQDRAQEIIGRQGANHRQRFDNNRIAHIAQMLNLGIYYYDASGNLIQTSSGAVVTVDMGVPAGNKGSVGGIIDASWATTSTNIMQHMENLDQKAIQATGRPIKHVFYGKNVPGYIYKNDSFKYYFQFNKTFYDQFASKPGTIPNGFLDKTWHPMRDMFYENESGTVVSLWSNDDQITLTPEIDQDVYTLFEGSVAIPTKIGVETDVANLLSGSEVRYGHYGYSIFTADPVQIKVVMGDNVMPMWKNPLDMYIVDTTP